MIHLSTKKGKAKPMRVEIEDTGEYERIFELTKQLAKVVEDLDATTLEVFAACETLKAVMWENRQQEASSDEE